MQTKPGKIKQAHTLLFITTLLFAGTVSMRTPGTASAKTTGAVSMKTPRIAPAQPPHYFLIAHRGGVVDSTNAENSLPALEGAIKRGYQMVEMDMRLTKDSFLIINHDRNFKRYYGLDSAVSDMDWDRIKRLRSSKGNAVMSLEQEFERCRRGHMQVMLDTKFENYDTIVFARVVTLLKKYGLQEQALMIGSDSSTGYFTGKVRLSCTRKQLEENSHRADYNSRFYYLFGGTNTMTEEDVQWANSKGIMVVGAVNIFTYRKRPGYLTEGAKDIATLKSWGVTRFQIDSDFDGAFFARN
ncbi:MAG: glycerophosphodiester phosphodiesterase family protein [Puia sp.]|nr:glycerophosphodiester phosphodiesterase family protein [Puia sp.]